MTYRGPFGLEENRAKQIAAVEVNKGEWCRPLQIDFHRNGVTGVGFWVAIVLHSGIEDGGPATRRMLVTTFTEAGTDDDFEVAGYGGYTSAIDLDVLGTEAGIAFGLNSWRGAATYEQAMVAFIRDIRYLSDLALYPEHAVEWHPKSRLAQNTSAK